MPASWSRDGETIAPVTRSVHRDSSRYQVARATLGLNQSGGAEISWISSREGTLYSFLKPPAHRPGNPVGELDFSTAPVWDFEEAVGAGPNLLHGGELLVTTNEEAFFGTALPEVHPRTAAGITASGSLILMVVDGRQTDSRGVYLEELAVLMQGAGAVTAMNLDGGGSSALVVNNTLINRPVGGSEESQVMSALVVVNRTE